jgi:hypothetical protein
LEEMMGKGGDKDRGERERRAITTIKRKSMLLHNLVEQRSQSERNDF